MRACVNLRDSATGIKKGQSAACITSKRRDATWLFSVRDNGVGIPPELGDDIFTMFKRAHGEEIEGTGIGLAVCRKIVEAHGGEIWTEPADGAGTVMRFTIPA